MKTKSMLLALLLMLIGLMVLPANPVLAQDEDEEFEFDEPIATDTEPGADAAAAPWPVCAYGHWIRSRFPSPPACTREHIDDLRGPLAPCSFIKIGGRWYHIVYVRRPYPGKVIIGVRPVYFTE
jgi:hypothetical protein